nr:MAG TPA: hypothetical protein [Caudoviricetes sp.]
MPTRLNRWRISVLACCRALDIIGIDRDLCHVPKKFFKKRRLPLFYLLADGWESNPL